jgi:hypothetical protein
MAVLPRDDVEIRPLTRSDVLRMVETGILAEDDRVELLDGFLVQVFGAGETVEPLAPVTLPVEVDALFAALA